MEPLALYNAETLIKPSINLKPSCCEELKKSTTVAEYAPRAISLGFPTFINFQISTLTMDESKMAHATDMYGPSWSIKCQQCSIFSLQPSFSLSYQCSCFSLSTAMAGSINLRCGWTTTVIRMNSRPCSTVDVINSILYFVFKIKITQ